MITGKKITSDVYVLHVDKVRNSEGKLGYILTKNNRNIATGTADNPEDVFKLYNCKISYSENKLGKEVK